MLNLYLNVSTLIYGFLLQRGKIGVQVLAGANKEALAVAHAAGINHLLFLKIVHES